MAHGPSRGRSPIWGHGNRHVRCPRAAEALIDWDGSEITRLRAFGIVDGALLHEFTSVQHEFLDGLHEARAALKAA